MIIKIVLLFGLMFLLMMIGAPIAVSLGVATMTTMIATTSIGLTTMATACFSGLDSFPLMAIPFFILAGNLMKSGGISRRILEFADAVVGWITGSVGMVTVVASMFFAALSGSSPATVTAIGSITIPKMKEEGPRLRHCHHRSRRDHRGHHSPQHPLCHLRGSRPVLHL